MHIYVTICPWVYDLVDKRRASNKKLRVPFIKTGYIHHNNDSFMSYCDINQQGRQVPLINMYYDP